MFAILQFRKPDGHFGKDFDLSQRLQPNTCDKFASLPMFWGNARMLVGLIAASLKSAHLVRLRPWGPFSVKQRAPFICNLVVVPAASLDAKRLEGLANRDHTTAPDTD
jgi:hypothetical protein